jgi:hypothetical protein
MIFVARALMPAGSRFVSILMWRLEYERDKRAETSLRT